MINVYMKKIALTEVGIDVLPLEQLIYVEETGVVIKLVDDQGIGAATTLDDLLTNQTVNYEVLFSKALRLNPKADVAAITAIVDPSDYAIVLDEATRDEYVFTLMAVQPTVIPNGAFADVNLTGIWTRVNAGLRLAPVVDIAALKLLVPDDFAIVQVLGDATAVPVREDATYVYKEGLLNGGPDDVVIAGLGTWLLQVATTPPTSFNYLYDDTAGTTPVAGHVSVDVDDEDAATILYLNKENQIGQDLSKFFSLLDVGQSVTVMNDILRNESYKYNITAPAVLTGDVFAVPVAIDVAKSSANGTIVDGIEVFISIKDEITIESLRLAPVADEAALIVIDAKDFMITKMLSEGRDYVFTEDVTINAVTNPIPANSFADSSSKGYWTAVLVETRFDVLSVGTEVNLDTQLPYDVTSVELYVNQALQDETLFSIVGNIITYNFVPTRKSKIMLLVK